MKITLLTITKNRIEVNIEPTDTVGKLREVVAKLKNVEENTLCLLYQSKMLKDDTKTMNDIGYDEKENMVILFKKTPLVVKKMDEVETPNQLQESNEIVKIVDNTPKGTTLTNEMVEENKVEIDQELLKEFISQGYAQDKVKEALEQSKNDKTQTLSILKGNPMEELNLFDERQQSKSPQLTIEINDETLQQVLEEIEQENPETAEQLRNDPQLLIQLILEQIQEDGIEIDDIALNKDLTQEDFDMMLQSGQFTEKEIEEIKEAQKLNGHDIMDMIEDNNIEGLDDSENLVNGGDVSDDISGEIADEISNQIANEIAYGEHHKSPKKPASDSLGSKPAKTEANPLNEEDEKAITDLMELGFSKAKCKEAFLVNNKNKEYAANYLFEHGYN
ncbi:UV excision repair protein RAD23 [Entamoeba marina]